MSAPLQLRASIGSIVTAIALLAAPPAAMVAATASQAEVIASFALDEGDAAFWDGPFVTHGSLLFGSQSGEDFTVAEQRGLIDACEWPGQGPCFRYELLIGDSAPGARLRVAIDSPTHDDKFGFELYSPNGALAGRVCCPTQDTYEVILADPAPGTWRLKAMAADVSYAAFRMRAALEAPTTEVGPPRPLLPNLRVEPPLAPTFTAPLESTGLTQAPLEAFGFRPLSCLPDEQAEDGATRCLRFDLGLQNTGDGPMNALFEPLTSGSASGNMTQRIHWSDGAHEDRPAGQFQWHATHGHYHLSALAKLDLYKVVDAKRGTLASAGDGHKQGFCLVDTKIAEWFTFRQDAQYSAEGDCTSQTEPRMGLTRGWTDMYHWYNAGNYVDFGENTDGLYVVRAEVDSERVILEANERDNFGYALVEVRGDEAWVIERGHGRDPWDPHKVVLH